MKEPSYTANTVHFEFGNENISTLVTLEVSQSDDVSVPETVTVVEGDGDSSGIRDSVKELLSVAITKLR